jgi:hypothetical protein
VIVPHRVSLLHSDAQMHASLQRLPCELISTAPARIYPTMPTTTNYHACPQLRSLKLQPPLREMNIQLMHKA